MRDHISDSDHTNMTQNCWERDEQKKTRPLVVKFQNFTDFEMVTYKSYDEEIKKNLKEKKQGIGVQSPQSYRDARKAFSQWVKKLEINLKKIKTTKNTAGSMQLWKINTINKTYSKEYGIKERRNINKMNESQPGVLDQN